MLHSHDRQINYSITTINLADNVLFLSLRYNSAGSLASTGFRFRLYDEIFYSLSDSHKTVKFCLFFVLKNFRDWTGLGSGFEKNYFSGSESGSRSALRNGSESGLKKSVPQGTSHSGSSLCRFFTNCSLTSLRNIVANCHLLVVARRCKPVWNSHLRLET